MGLPTRPGALLEGGGGEEISTLWQGVGLSGPAGRLLGGGRLPNRPGALLEGRGVRRCQRCGRGGDEWPGR